MDATMLSEIRATIESLASDDGSYVVVCERTGERPFPATGKRFPDRAAAEEAMRAVVVYRETLRRYDPRTYRYDMTVVETPASLRRSDHRPSTAEDGTDRVLLSHSTARGDPRPLSVPDDRTNDR
ncbi:hypothetical protein ACFOZ7_21280 [Natribaculum luteum]|uniref:DUF7552 domain-containing protein n=1 Tax=Natribaculum luteum TaxID=1586232 RepID=A0ABD5P5F0_9EURY|nr:hypothetical protein [Natribaculum luteum]